MREIDKNGDDKLSKDEFHDLIKQVIDIISNESAVN
jgi:hypothetical protein